MTISPCFRAAAVCLALAGPLTAQQPISSNIIVRLGNDTLSAEHSVRTGSHIEGDVVRRLPEAMQWHYTIELDASGLPSQFVVTPVRNSRGTKFTTRNITIRFANDSAYTDITRDTVIHRASAGKHGFANFPEVYGFLELCASWMRANKIDSTIVTLSAPVGGISGGLRLQLKGDEMIAYIFGSPVKVKLDAQSRALVVDGTGSTLKYLGTQDNNLNLDRVFGSLAHRDSVAGAAGAFITGRDTVRATVAGAALWVDYGRPLTRGRNVFANGVLGDTLWRTGANAATQFRTDKDLDFGGGKVLKAGVYTLWTHWNGAAVELVINAQTGQWGTAYDGTKDVMRVPMTITRGAATEKFTISTEQIPDGGALKMAWDDRILRVPFTVQSLGPPRTLDALRTEFVRAYNTGDAPAMNALYADAAVRMPYDAPQVVGRTAIVAAFLGWFVQRPFTAKLEFIVGDVKQNGDRAVERGLYKELQTLKSGEMREEDGKYVAICVQAPDGSWQYEWSIFNRDGPSRNISR